MERFNELKQELLKRAKDAGACKEQYARAYSAETLEALMEVCRDNFHWACGQKVLDVDIITQYREEFAVGLIYANEDVTQGQLLCDNASVEAWGNASVVAYGNASVEACGNASVEAWGNASVEAWGNASVKACGNASVEAWGNASVVACGNASVKAYDNASVVAWGNASVKAWGNTHITSYSIIEVKLSDNAIYRIRKYNIVRYANPNIKFELVE